MVLLYYSIIIITEAFIGKQHFNVSGSSGANFTHFTHCWVVNLLYGSALYCTCSLYVLKFLIICGVTIAAKRLKE